MVDILSTKPLSTFGALKAPTPPEKKSYGSYFVALLIILILGVAAYFLLYKGIGFSLAAPDFTPAPPLTVSESRIAAMPPFSFEFLDSPFYKSLKIYGNLPIVVDSLGRANPFIPY